MLFYFIISIRESIEFNKSRNKPAVVGMTSIIVFITR